MNTDLTISIIDTNNREQTLQCLRSIFEGTRVVRLHVFVVDNASADQSGQAIQTQFPQVTVLRNPRPLGFSSNNNQVLAQAVSRYLMLLNDDTVVHPGAFDTMIEYADAQPRVGVIGARLLNPDGTDQQCYDRTPGLFHELFRPFSCRLRTFPKHFDQPFEVDYVSGACMMIRREVVADTGLLDPAFDPIYSEEADWCFRIQKAGWKIVHLPHARVTHLGSQTMNRTTLKKAELLYEKKTLYFRKHRGATIANAYKTGLFVTSLIKLAAGCLLYPVLRDSTVVARHWHIARRSMRF